MEYPIQFFAAAEAPPSFVGNTVLALGILVSLAVNVMSLVRGGKTQKRDVTIEDGAARATDLKRVEGEVKDLEKETKQLFAEIRAQLTTHRTERRDDSQQLFEQVRGVTGQIAKLQGVVEHMNQEMQQTTSRLNSHIEKART